MLGEETMCLHLLPVCGILARPFLMLLGRSHADYRWKLGDKRNVRRRRQCVCTYIRFLLYWIVFVLSSLESPVLTTGGNKVTGVTSEYQDHVPASTSGLLILVFSFLEDTMLTSGGIKFTAIYVSRQVKRSLFISGLCHPHL